MDGPWLGKRWAGADGTKPHHHAGSAELFYVLDGAARLLSGDQVVTAERGDLVVVPPKVAHAFAAAPGERADLLIVITPGVELYDTYFQLSPAWDADRRSAADGC